MDIPSYPTNCPSELSLLQLTGAVSVNTPKCVLVELADSLQLEYPTLDNVMQRYLFCGIVNGSPLLALPTPSTRESWLAIGRIINSSIEEWDVSRIDLALKFILRFLQPGNCSHPTCDLPLGNYPIGRPTQEFPEALSASILYRICRIHNLELTFETTLEEMFQIVTLIHRPLPQLRELTLGVVQQLPYPMILDGYVRLSQLSHQQTASVAPEPLVLYPPPTTQQLEEARQALSEESSTSTSEVEMEEPEGEDPEEDADPDVEEEVEVEEDEDQDDDNTSSSSEGHPEVPNPNRSVPDEEIVPLLRIPIIETPGTGPIGPSIEIVTISSTPGPTGSLPVQSSEESLEKRRRIDASGGYQSYIDTYKMFNDHRQILVRVSPQTELEAVTLAVINYGVDISSSRYPFQEYAQLNNTSLLNRPGITSPVSSRRRGRRPLPDPSPTPATGQVHLPPISREVDGPNPPSIYQPVDPDLRSRYLEDPDSILLRNNFNPQFPSEYYSPALLLSLCIAEGYLSSEVTGNDMHELLQLAHVSNNFYHGKMPEMTNSSTLLYPEEIKGLSGELLVCYGIREQSMVAFQYKELADWFQSSNSLINPADTRNEPFEPRAIRKLKQLCRKKRKNESEDTWNIRRQLLKTIEYIEANLTEKNERFLELSRIYKDAAPELRHQIYEAIKSLMDIGFYCRGWMGPPDIYPVEVVTEKRLEDVEIRVTMEFANFKEKCKQLGETGELIMNLPLLKFSTTEFIVNTNERIGLTVKDKLDIIAMGNERDATESCIALSSSYLVSTAYHVARLLQFDLPFDIAGLRSIHQVAT